MIRSNIIANNEESIFRSVKFKDRRKLQIATATGTNQTRIFIESKVQKVWVRSKNNRPYANSRVHLS